MPKKVYGHGWLTIDGGKISKSKGNYKDPREFIENYGTDTLRYYILSAVPFGSDGNFSEMLMVQRRNSDLANILGNLVNRTVSMTNKYFGGSVKRLENPTELDQEVIKQLTEMPKLVETKIDALDAPAALEVIFDSLKRLNKYIDETTPWILGKDEATMPRLNDVLYLILEGIRVCAVQLKPFIPATAEKIFVQLNTEAKTFNDELLSVESYKVVEKPEILFQRIDEEEVAKRLEEETAPKVKHLPEITFDDFGKTELVVGKVIESKRHPKADKLLVSQIDIGFGEIRQIVTGIADKVKPEEFVGKKVVVVANLKPAKIRGIESQGMVLVGEDEKSLSLVSSDVEVGTRIK